MNYPPEAILHLARLIKGNNEGGLWLQKNNYPELILLHLALKGDEDAMKELAKRKHAVLTAFAHAMYNDDAHAAKWLAENKKFEWAAVARIVNKKDRAAEAWLMKHKLIHFAGLAKVMREKEQETQDEDIAGMLRKFIRSFRKK